jgi:plasmid replication initiation protein
VNAAPTLQPAAVSRTPSATVNRDIVLANINSHNSAFVMVAPRRTGKSVDAIRFQGRAAAEDSNEKQQWGVAHRA